MGPIDVYRVGIMLPDVGCRVGLVEGADKRGIVSLNRHVENVESVTKRMLRQLGSLWRNESLFGFKRAWTPNLLRPS